MELGAISGATSGIAQAGTILGLAGEAVGPLLIGVQTLIGVAGIPSDVNENLWKIYYIADVSGILTSWMFSDPTFSPHSQLHAEAQNGGYFGADLTGALREAHQKAHELWQSSYREHPERVRQARQAAGGDYQNYWRALGNILEERLHPRPSGVATARIDDLIHGIQRRREEHRRRQQQEKAIRRNGGIIRTPDGHEFFIPPE